MTRETWNQTNGARCQAELHEPGSVRCILVAWHDGPHEGWWTKWNDPPKVYAAADALADAAENVGIYNGASKLYAAVDAYRAMRKP